MKFFKKNANSNYFLNSENYLLEELLFFNNEHFIYHAYRLLLGRAPDPEGMLYYLTRLRGGVDKIEILAQLYLSKERKSRAQQISIIGLKEAIRPYRVLKIPVLGKFLRRGGLFTRKPKGSAFDAGVKEYQGQTFEFANEILGELIGIDVSMRPIHQLEILPGQGVWNSLGQDPHFGIEFNGGMALDSGWYLVHMCICSQQKRGLAKLYLNSGGGFNETDTVSLPYRTGEVVCRVFSTKNSMLSIRFDPMEDHGEFQIEAFELKSISEHQAVPTMLQRLTSKGGRYDGMSLEDAFVVVEALAQIENVPVVQYLAKLYLSTFHSQQTGIDYEEWIENVELATQPSHEAAQAAILAMVNTPLISVVMPVYNTPEVYLRACIDSVLAQSYPNWELCIADDASPKPHVRKLLDEYERKDQRIRVVYRSENGHISLASNSALGIVKGEYVALLDHDDELPVHALYFVAKAINKNPEVQVIYSDEDKIDTQGIRSDPHFKSDWNPDLFFSQNYVSHLGVYRRDILKKIGGFRPGLEGSQDQDLLLRCLPYVLPDNIVHIPRILYHWRTVEGSTALASGEKSYTTEAGIKALKDYFAENYSEPVAVEAGWVPNTYRIGWPIPHSEPLVSLLIPTRDKKSITEIAVRSILKKTTYHNYEIIILDNGSVEPETLRFFAAIQREDARVSVLRYDHPFNYSAINNFGVANTKGKIIGLINNDVEVISPEWLTEMVGHVCRHDIGCVGAKLYYSNDTLQHGGVIIGLGGVANHSHKNFDRNHPGYFARLVTAQNISAVTAACLLVRREIYEEVGGLDEVNLKVAFNDVDFCLKVREAGYRNLWTPYAELYHHESISRGNEDTPEKQERFRSEVIFMQNKWGRALENDPYYNPNLTRTHEDFSINFEINLCIES